MTYNFQQERYQNNYTKLVFQQGDREVWFPLGDQNEPKNLGTIREYFWIGFITRDNEYQITKTCYIKDIMIVDQHESNTTIQLFYGDKEKEEGSTNSIKLSLPTDQKTANEVNSKDEITKTVLDMFKNKKIKIMMQRDVKRQTTERNALRF